MKGKNKMKTKTKMTARICLLVCVVLCAALILAQFVPYWTPDEEAINKAAAGAEVPPTDTGAISILQYLILPSSYPTVTEYLDTEYKGAAADPNPTINSLAGTFSIIFLLGIVSIIFICVKPKSRWIAVWPFAVGVGSLIGYLTEPLWALGSIHIVLVILSAALVVVSAIPLVIWLSSFRYWFMDPKDLPNAK